MAKTFRVKYAEVEVYEDNYENGEGEYVNGWNLSIKGKTFKSLSEIVDAVSNEEYIFSDDKKNWIYMDGRLLTDALVDVNNEEPDEADIQMWRNGDLELFVARLDIAVEVYDEAHDLTEEEAEEEGFEIY